MSRLNNGEPDTRHLSEKDFASGVEELLRCRDREFQEFILRAVHDLRGPLRTVNTCCELLARKDMERSESETDQIRRHIVEGADKMQELLSGLVDYATAVSDSRRFLLVDMNDVFRDAAVYTGSRRSVIIDPLASVRGDFDTLVKVARHLLDNATRYCETPDPRIHVSSRNSGADWLFIVRDNGPGIDAAYHSQIFDPFKRLHGRRFTGNGLGLAFCRKAVESHGGRIWVESTPGHGATFLFTLPSD